MIDLSLIEEMFIFLNKLCQVTVCFMKLSSRDASLDDNPNTMDELIEVLPIFLG